MPYYVTFYSYKGGVGRTLTLVNTAVSLVQLGHSVFIWEMDLEAPGVLNLPFFRPLRDKAKGGSVDIIASYPQSNADDGVSRFTLEHPEFEAGRLRLLPAGAADQTYSQRFASIRWDKLFGDGSTAGSQLFELMRQSVDSYQSDFVLIDSRTGLTDIGAICTVQLADLVVLVYNYGHQNLAGTRNIQQALDQEGRRKEYRKNPLKILRVACPVPGDLPELAKERRAAAKNTGPLVRAAKRKRAIQEEFNLTPHFEIPFQPSLLLEEKVWVVDFPDDPLSTRYRDLARDLIAAGQVSKPAREVLHQGSFSRGALIGEEELPKGFRFEQKVAELLRLMGFDVELPTSRDAAQSDFIAVKREPLEEVRYVVECKLTDRPLAAADVDRIIGRMAAMPAGTRGLIVSHAGFSENAKKNASKAALTLRSYDELLSSLVDWTAYLQWLIQDYRGGEIERLYVEPNVWPESEEAPLGLAEYVEGWLRENQSTHLTLLGDYGTGKTWFTRRFAYALAARAQSDPERNRIPIRIDLRQAARALKLETILYEHLRERLGRDVNPKSVLFLLAEGRLVLIFDGFDEMATQANWEMTLENFRELARAADGNAKVLLTCRTHYFKAQSQVRELLDGRKPEKTGGETELYREVRSRRGFGVAHLLEFNNAQIEDYLRRACGERAPEVQSAIERIPGLQDIAARPVLLDMIVASAPMLEKTGAQIKVANLYQIYTESWLERQDWRLKLTREGRTALVEELAARLWRVDGARIHYRELADVLAAFLKDRITTDRDLEMADAEVRTASFLTRDEEGNYGFSHRSFLEFFLARRTARLLEEAGSQKPPRPNLVEALRLRKLSPQVIGLLEDLCPEDALIEAVRAILGGPYTSLSSENALLLYASMKIQRSKLDRIELEGAELGGFLLSGCELSRAVLRNANLAGADLSYSGLKSADLTGALLQQTNLNNTSCAGCSFRGANLTGASIVAADLVDADLTGAEISFALMAGAKLDRAVMDGTIANGTGFYRSSITPGQIKRLVWTRAPGSPQPDREVLSLMAAAGIGDVSAVAYSPDGKLLAAGFQNDNRVFIFDTATGLCRRSLAGHAGQVLAVCWRDDGQELASGSYDNTIRLWDVESGKQVRTLEGHKGWVLSVAYRPDGRELATGSDDNTIRLWEVESGKEVRKMEGHKGWVRSVVYRPDGRELASGSDDNTIRLWEVESGKQVRKLEGHKGWVLSVAYRPDGRELATGSYDNTIRLWEVESGREVRKLEGHKGWVLSVAYRPDGHELATGSYDNTIRLWDVESGKEVRKLEGHKGMVWSVAYRPDGRELATGSYDNTIRLWEVESGKEMRKLEGHKGLVRLVAYRPDGRELATGSDDNTIRLWDVESGKQVRKLEGHKGMVWSVAYRSDGRELATGSYDGTIRLWEVESGREVRKMEGHKGSDLSVAYRPDGRELATGSDDNTIRLWDAESGKQVRTLEGHKGWIRSVAYRPDGLELASGSDDNTIRLWEVESGKQVRTLEGHKGGVPSVAYRPDGRELATGSDDNTIRLWEVESGKEVRKMEGHKGLVSSVAYRPDGQEVASGSSDNTIRLWDVESGKQVRTLEGHKGGVSSVAYRPDSLELISASDDGVVRIWEIESGRCLAELYYFEQGGWLSITPDGRFMGNEIGKRSLTFIDKWASYPAELFPEFEDAEAVRSALTRRQKRSKKL